MSKEVYIAMYNNECEVRNTLEEAYKALCENSTHEPDFEETQFFKAAEIKVEQILRIKE